MLRLDVRVIAISALVAACFSTTGCSGRASDQAQKKPMTKAQLDSAIAESRLPGAGVVGKSLEVADSARVRANTPIPEPQ